MIPCPKCKEFNDENTTHCAAGGARLDEPAKPDPGRGTLLKENIPNILWLAAGAVFLLLGIFVPALGSAIVQFVMLFAESDHASRQSIVDAQPGKSDAWPVIGASILCFLFGGFGLYASLKKFWAKRLDKSEPSE